MFISDLRLKREFCCFPSFEMFDNWIEEKGKEVLFRKVLAFVLIRQQEGSYAGSHRAMAKDISSSCLCECQGQKQQILFLSSSQGRDDQTASLKRAILLLRFESECYFLPRNVAYSLHCHRKVHCLQLSIVQVLTKGRAGEKDKLSFLHKRALGHIRDLKGLLHELNNSSILAIMIIFILHLYFWRPTNIHIFKWKESFSFNTFILLQWFKRLLSERQSKDDNS